MGEGVAAATSQAASGAAKKIAGSILNPGIQILTFWQGIVEIILRGAIIVLCLIVIIAGSVAQDSIDPARPISGIPVNVPAASAAAGWLLFLGVIGLIYDAVFVIQRFLNFNIINSYFIYVIIVDAIFHAVIAAGTFAGAAATASYVPEWRELEETTMFGTFFGEITRSSEALAVFAFFLIVPCVAVAVFMVLGGFIFKWKPTLAKYEASAPASSEPE